MHSNNSSHAARVTPGRAWLIAGAAAIATLAVVSLFGLLHPGTSHAASAKGPLVSTGSTSLGKILVDSRGHTLYLFEKDKHGKSACTGKCASFWPPLIASAKPRAAGSARASLLGTTRRADGRLQVTYNHHPVYRFAQDTRKGQTHGEGVDAFGAEWYVISPAGAKVEHEGGGYGG